MASSRPECEIALTRSKYYGHVLRDVVLVGKPLRLSAALAVALVNPPCAGFLMGIRHTVLIRNGFASADLLAVVLGDSIMHMAKVKFLKQHGFILAPRCPNVLPNAQGDFMVINKERTYASVGYDAEDLVNVAYQFVVEAVAEVVA